MYKNVDVLKVHSGTREDTYKDPQKPSIGFLDPSYWLLGPGTARGESDPSGSPLGVPNWSEIENLCENHVFWAFSVFWNFLVVSDFWDFI